MSYKPDESTLIAYLYDELNAEERERVELYLLENPEMRREIEEMRSTRELLGKWPDQEVTEPTFVFDDSNVVVVSRSMWKTGFFRTTLGIAASIALLLLVGYFTNFSATQNEHGWQISLGNQSQPVENTPQFTEENVKAWMQEAVAENNAVMLQKINDVESGLSSELATQQELNQKAIQSVKLRPVNSTIDESILQSYVAQLKQENKEILLSLMEASREDQQQYVNQVLADFSDYLEQQRAYDLEMIQANFSLLKDDTETSQLETNQLLTSLITTVNNQNN